MTMGFSKTQAIQIASLIRLIRPEWDFPGVMASLAKLGDLDVVTAAQTALQAAGDPLAETPGAMTNPAYRPLWGQEKKQAMGRNSSRILQDIRAIHENRDVESGHRGYLDAIAALEAARNQESA